MSKDDFIDALTIKPETMSQWDKMANAAVKELLLAHPDFPQDPKYYRSFLKRVLPLIRGIIKDY